MAEEERAQRGAAGMGARRKGSSSIRAWLVVSDAGGSRVEEAGKHSMMRRTGLPARDLRVLDPLLSYPSTILGRERAIVINLEHIKAVITASEVLVPNSNDPAVAPFLRELHSRVLLSPLQGSEHGVSKAPWSSPSSSSPANQEPHFPRADLDAQQDKAAKLLPFEFRVLEVCLDSACRLLESETETLEQEAYPALDELTSKISTLNLERVRQIKSRLVAISGRVQKARDELEHLLDDDMDMAEMYLTEKLARQPIVEMDSRTDMENEIFEVIQERNGVAENETESSSGSLGAFKPNIEELEMLLEAYFVQIDGTLNKLSTLREYVDDTEDYINIMLDEKQNQLLEMGVMLSMATLVCSAGIVVVSVFGMNIGISLYNETGSSKFWETTFGTVAGCIVLYFIAIGWGKKSGLLH